MADRVLLMRAAKLLDEEADFMRESCEGLHGWLWTCTSCQRDENGMCSTMRNYNEFVRTAAALRQEAARGR